MRQFRELMEQLKRIAKVVLHNNIMKLFSYIWEEILIDLKKNLGLLNETRGMSISKKKLFS